VPAPSGTGRIVAFFALAYAISWAWWLPIAFDGATVERGDASPSQVPGLFGPLIAALIVLAASEGRAGLRAWGAAIVRPPRELRWQLASIAPLGFLLVGLLVVTIAGDAPPASDFIRYSGTTATVAAFGVVLIAGALGEEAGWRGYALPRLQARLGPLRATFALTVLWAGWHAPLFVILGSYEDFNAFILLGFFIGLAAGALVLTAVFNGAGGSVLATTAWHASYNLAAGTAATGDAIAPIATAFVIFWGVTLLQRERAGLPALGGAR
jgi:membrane protease YdiL (CAAX protease family)